MATWETREVSRSLVNSSMNDCNLSAEALEEMFDEAVPEPNSFVQEILVAFIQESLQQVDWDEIAGDVSDGTVICVECDDSIHEEYTKNYQWTQDDGMWYCRECRPDYEECEECSEFFPGADLVDGICEECLAEEKAEEEKAEEEKAEEEKAEEEKAEEEVEETVEPPHLKIGDYVDKPYNQEVGTYDYGVIVGTTLETADVCWFKWGFIPEQYRSGLNVVYNREKLSDLVQVGHVPIFHEKTMVSSIHYVEEGDTVYQINACRTGVVKKIYSLLKRPDIIRLAVETSTGMRFWDRTMCQKVKPK